jgi:hypothetical protein
VSPRSSGKNFVEFAVMVELKTVKNCLCVFFPIPILLQVLPSGFGQVSLGMLSLV